VRAHATTTPGPGGFVIAGRARQPDGVTTCFSFEATLGLDGLSTATYEDGAGNLVGMIAPNQDGSITYTCAGQPATVIPAACHMSADMSMSGASCTPGVCT
jgi:hypothetical protein